MNLLHGLDHRFHRNLRQSWISLRDVLVARYRRLITEHARRPWPPGPVACRVGWTEERDQRNRQCCGKMHWARVATNQQISPPHQGHEPGDVTDHHPCGALAGGYDLGCYNVILAGCIHDDIESHCAQLY